MTSFVCFFIIFKLLVYYKQNYIWQLVRQFWIGIATVKLPPSSLFSRIFRSTFDTKKISLNRNENDTCENCGSQEKVKLPLTEDQNSAFHSFPPKILTINFIPGRILKPFSH